MESRNPHLGVKVTRVYWGGSWHDDHEGAPWSICLTGDQLAKSYTGVCQDGHQVWAEVVTDSIIRLRHEGDDEARSDSGLFTADQLNGVGRPLGYSAADEFCRKVHASMPAARRRHGWEDIPCKDISRGN